MADSDFSIPPDGGIYNHDIINAVLKDVSDQMEAMQGLSVGWAGQAEEVMSNIGISGEIPNPPGYPTFSPADVSGNIPSTSATFYPPVDPGTPGDYTGGMPVPISPELPDCTVDSELEEIPPIPTPDDIGTFDPAPIDANIPGYTLGPFVPSIDITPPPPPPAVTPTFPMPSEPPLDDVVIPGAPVYELPDEPDWVEINAIVGDEPVIPTFDFQFKALPPTPPTLNASYEVTEYAEQILNVALPVMQRVLEGSGILDARLQDALVSSGRDREQRISRTAENALEMQWSNRGFSFPPGAMDDALYGIRRESSLKERAYNRTLTIELLKIEIDALKFSIDASIKAEQVYADIWKVQNTLIADYAKYTLDLQFKTFGLATESYKLAIAELQAHVALFEAEMTGVTAQWGFLVEKVKLEIAKGGLNDSMARVYASQADAIKSYVALYAEEIQAAGERLKLNGDRLDNYGKEIETVSDKIRAHVALLGTYTAHAQYSTAQASVISAEANAYEANARGQATGIDASAKVVGAQADVIRAEATAYTAKNSSIIDTMRAHSAHVEAVGRSNLAKLQQATEAIRGAVAQVTGELSAQSSQSNAYAAAISGHYSAESSRMQAIGSYNSAQAAGSRGSAAVVAANVSAGEAKARLAISAAEAAWKTQGAVYNEAVNAWLTSVTGAQKQAVALINAQIGAGQVYGNLASGAMSGMHVSATAGGQATNNASNSSNWGRSETHSYQEKCCDTNDGT